MSKIKLIPINGSVEDIEKLYIELSSRSLGISHTTLPSFEDHKDFVLNHPYLAWYFIVKDDAQIGTCYVTDQNTIGLNAKFVAVEDLATTLSAIKSLHRPLLGIKSIRSSSFTINVPIGDAVLQEMLEGVGGIPIQISFKVL